MKKMNKKGFTLIELLTVIAILAVILLIAAPTILGVLDKAKKNTFKNQVLLYVSGLKTQMALAATGDSSLTLDWKTENDVTSADVTIETLNSTIMDNAALTEGTITVTQSGSKYSYSLTKVGNDDYCIASLDLATKADFDISSISSGKCSAE